MACMGVADVFLNIINIHLFNVYVYSELCQRNMSEWFVFCCSYKPGATNANSIKGKGQ